MFQRLIDDIKAAIAGALQLTSLAAVIAVALLVAIGFLCAAAFVYVLQHYGPIEACLTGAAVFFVVTLIAAACYAVRRNQIKAHVAEKVKSTAQSALADPMVLAVGLQLIRAIGVRKLVPLLAAGGLALGLLAGRANSGSGARKTDPKG